MDIALLIIIICLSVLLITSVMFQKMGNGGLGGAFGGGGGDGNDFQTRRGMEKYLFYLTIVCIIGIGSLSLLYLFL